MEIGPPNGDDIARFTASRRRRAGRHVIVSIIASFAILLLINSIASKKYARWRLSAEGLQSGLSDITKQTLNQVTDEIDVTMLYKKGSSLYATVEALLREYEQEQPLIRVRMEDPESAMGSGQALLDRYQLSGAKDAVVFDRGGDVEIVFDSELSEYDFGAFMQDTSQEIQRTGFKGERLFTSAIYSLLVSSDSKAYFLAGHGEGDPTSSDPGVGFRRFGAMLSQNGVSFETLTLTDERGIPEDCDLLIIAGPRTRFNRTELTRLSVYLGTGGRLFVMAPSESPTGLEQVLQKWGILLSQKPVIDTASKYSANFGDLIITNFFGHEVMKPLLRSQLYMARPQAVFHASLTESTNAPTIQPLFWTTKKGRIVSRFEDGAPEFGADDWTGEAPLAVAGEWVVQDPATGQASKSRLVVVGDSAFLAEPTINSVGNRLFAESAVNWLLDRSKLIGNIETQEISSYRILLTESQRARLRWALLLGLPAVPALLGGIVWIRRRN